MPVPVDAPANAVGPDGRAYLREQPIESPWGTFSFTCVSMGNPHAVCFVDDWATVANSLFDDPSDKRLATFASPRTTSTRITPGRRPIARRAPRTCGTVSALRSTRQAKCLRSSGAKRASRICTPRSSIRATTCWRRPSAIPCTPAARRSRTRTRTSCP